MDTVVDVSFCVFGHKIRLSTTLLETVKQFF